MKEKNKNMLVLPDLKWVYTKGSTQAVCRIDDVEFILDINSAVYINDKRYLILPYEIKMDNSFYEYRGILLVKVLQEDARCQAEKTCSKWLLERGILDEYVLDAYVMDYDNHAGHRYNEIKKYQ